MHELIEILYSDPSALVATIAGFFSLAGFSITCIFSAGVYWRTFQMVKANLEELAKEVRAHGEALAAINARCDSHQKILDGIVSPK